jgi:exopolysaccharide biosynthesis polyprenyl glycosylphosphotransferase
VPLTLAFFEAVVIFIAAYARFLAEDRALGSSDSGLVAAQALTLTLSGLFAFHFNDLYDLRTVRRFGQFAARLPKALAMMVLLVGAVHLLIPGGLRIGWRPLAETVFVVIAVLLPLRAALHHLFTARPFSRRVLVLGTTELAGKLVREILAEPDLRDVVVGVADDGSGAFKPTLPSLRLGPIDSLGKIIDGFEPDLIVCALAERHDPLLLRVLLTPRARGVPVEDGIVTYERLTGKTAIEYAAPRAVLFSKEFEASATTLFLARALSAAVAACALVLLSPFLVPVAVLIKLDSEGPVFFRHRRVGLGGRPFDLIKFRTMHPGGAPSEWAADNGHRTTRVGVWLRRFRIDELPQFLNILQGEMNLVGPRPHPVSNVELFTENIPYYGVRCSVRPGVTGWAQIRYGYANNLREETEKMRYDLHYIKHMSLGLDVRILFETVKVVVKGGRLATLADEPGAQVSPIYFGIERPRDGRGPARFSEPPWEDVRRPVAEPGPTGATAASPDAPSLEEGGAGSPRAHTRDVA